MRKIMLLFLIITMLISICACQNVQTPDVTVPTEPSQVPVRTTAKISGEFTATVRSLHPDYILDAVTPSLSAVTPYQSNLFMLNVGQEIAAHLEIGQTYVFTVNTVFSDYSKDMLQSLSTAALFELIPDLQVTGFRPAEDGETGLASLKLTIE